MEIADARLYAEGMRRQIERFATLAIQLEIVDDVQQWCVQHQTTDCKGNPAFRAVKCGGGTLEGIILVQRRIEAPQLASITSRINIPTAAALLATPQEWMNFQVLHELAHLENQWAQEREDDCDEWAMERFLASRA